jgi:hypothetical protein
MNSTTTIANISTYKNITNYDKIKFSSENNRTFDPHVNKGYGNHQHLANATTSNLEYHHEAHVTVGGSETDRGNHTNLPFQKIASLKSEAIWIINGSLLLFLCISGLLLSLYLRKKDSRDESMNPKNKSIKVLAIAGGIVTAVSDTTAQEKVEMVCRTFDTRHDQPDFERFTIPRI